jgi:Ras-related protein Rab-2A
MVDEWLLKICSIGSFQVGKTSLIRRYAENKFEVNYLPTIGIDITSKRIVLDDQEIKLILVDTAGQEAFGRIRRSYYMGCVGCLVVYDITRRETFEEISFWINDFNQVKRADYIPVSIIGNKIDLKTQRKVSTKEGEEFALKNGFLFYECSAKLGGDLIPEVYTKLVQRYLEARGLTP